MAAAPETTELVDLGPDRDRFLREALEGLRADPKTLPCKYFYDERGSVLFEKICELDEYYPTRTELSIMETHGEAMGDEVGPRALIVEYGSGSSTKTRILLDRLAEPAGYVPVDISREHLRRSADALAERHPEIPVLPVCADFTQPFDVPEPDGGSDRTIVYFPGSTIGNFEPPRAQHFLEQMRGQCKPDGGILIGVDLKKEPEVLEAAYDDAEGVTAAFNRNLLVRMNRELGSDFDVEAFAHRALWNDAEGRIEMHLESRSDQAVTMGDAEISFAAGETIHTENSYKYGLEDFAELADAASLDVQRVWTDERELFSVQYLAAR